MYNWGQLFMMLGLASLIVIEMVGVTEESKFDFVPVVPSDFSTKNLDFEPMSNPPRLTARPLFRQTRRPPEIPVRNVVQPIEQAPSVPVVSKPTPEQVPTFQHQLTAVVITGNEAVAYLINPLNLDLIRLKKGDQIDGWTLRDVLPNAVVLGYGTKEQARLELWADTRKEEFSVHLNENQDAQVDLQHSQREFFVPESLPTEPPGRPVRGPRSRVH